MARTFQLAKVGLMAAGLSVPLSQTASASIVNLPISTPPVHLSVPTPSFHAPSSFHVRTSRFKAPTGGSSAGRAHLQDMSFGNATGKQTTGGGSSSGQAHIQEMSFGK